MMTLEEIAASNYDAAIDAMSGQYPDYDSLEDAIESFASNAYDSAREQGYSEWDASAAASMVRDTHTRKRASEDPG